MFVKRNLSLSLFTHTLHAHNTYYFNIECTKAGAALIERIRKHMVRRTWSVLPTDVKLLVAQSSTDAGVLGAALAAKNAVKAAFSTSSLFSSSASLFSPSAAAMAAADDVACDAGSLSLQRCSSLAVTLFSGAASLSAIFWLRSKLSQSSPSSSLLMGHMGLLFGQIGAAFFAYQLTRR